VGDKPMRLLGIHSNPDRVVNYLDRKSDASGYPVLDEELEPATASEKHLVVAGYGSAQNT
jgi:hypothetical protein